MIGMNNKEYRPTIAQIRTFVTIADTRHFGTAASKLGISQPSLSQALVAIEKGLGVQLIERSTRRVLVTPIGEQLLPFAKATLASADALINNAHGAGNDLSGTMTIGMIPTIAPYLLPSFLRTVDRDYPELQPRIVEDQTKHLLQQLRDGLVDVAVLALPAATNGLVEVELYEEQFIVVVPDDHPFAGRDDLQLSNIADLNLLLLDDGHCFRDQILDLCRSAELSASDAANSVARAASLGTVMQCVIGGLGATLVPESAVTTETTRPGLATATFAPEVKASRTIGLVYRSSSGRGQEFGKLGEIVRESFEEALPAHS